MKRFFKVSILLLLFAVLSCICVNAKEYSGTYEGINWVFNDATGKLTISGSGNVPENITAMDYPWYESRKSIKSVVIEDSVTHIGRLAFASCSNLTEVSMGKNVTSIGPSAFSNCESLTEIELPEMITTIPANLFTHCTNLKQVIIPEKVTSIGMNAFYKCESLQKITMNEKMNYIDEYAFMYCTNLKEVHIQSIEKWCDAFIDGTFASPFCNGADLYVDNNKITNLNVTDMETLHNKRICNYAFCGCTSLQRVTIGGKIVNIGEGAFMNCNNLESVVLEDSVTYIYPSAFQNCSALENIRLSKNIQDKIQGFSYCESLESFCIPPKVTEISRVAFRACNNMKSVYIPSCVTTITDAAFLECESLEAVYFGGSREEWEGIKIGEYNTVLDTVKIYFNSYNIMDAVVSKEDLIKVDVTLTGEIKGVIVGVLMSEGVVCQVITKDAAEKVEFEFDEYYNGETVRVMWIKDIKSLAPVYVPIEIAVGGKKN